MTGRLRKNVTKQKTPLIVELVGPAGAGKTTLLQALSQSNEKFLIGANLAIRKKEHIPIFANHAPFLLPVFLRQGRQSRWFTWDEIKAMVYLKAWPRVLRQQAANNGGVVLLDHGPVFRLAMLLTFGPESLKSQGFEQWWNETIKQWAFTLDTIILLDAPDSILIERINRRSQRHIIKGKSEPEMYRFLARYRASYKQILAKLMAYRGPLMLEFDASQLSIKQIVDEVLETWDLKPSGNQVD